ncbi:UvrD-helicase domain-containing protein, partial [Candidatus Pacearchaeota archaeon]|nr:UvrD-helicase domain-containing protein [Candidatus Pacearchaeota archaeon]
MSDMAGSLKKSLGFDDEKLRNQASIVLSRILHNYSYFAVSTIDSFFQRIIGAFTRESGIAGGYSIELDQEKVISDIIDQIYQDITEDQNLRNWLVRYSETKVDENRNWDVRYELIMHGKNLLKEDYQKISEEVNKSFESDEDKIAFINELSKARAVIENTLSGYAKEGLEIIAKYGLEIDDFSYKSSGVAGYLLKLSNKNIDKPGIRIQDALNDKEKWCAKNSPRKAEIIRALNDGLFNQLIKCIEFYNKNFRIYNTILSVLPLFHGFAILLEIDNRLNRYRIENRMILVSDLTKFLRQIIGENDTPFIYEKTGSLLNHFLIDEFQDTSTYQWENFKPLITNAIAQNNRCLVVGDVKQSIYRWRGGDWRVITSGLKSDVGQERILTYELDTNWRSLP